MSPVPFKPSQLVPAGDGDGSVVDLTALVLRSQQDEQLLGVELSGLYAAATVWSDGETELEVNGVMNITAGRLHRDLEVVSLVEDEHGRVIVTDRDVIWADKVHGFAAFCIEEELPARAAVRHLRIYPQPW